jgi:hypothetical protein
MPREEDYGRGDLVTARREFGQVVDRITRATAERRRLDAEAEAATKVGRAGLEEQMPALKGRSS